MMALLRPDLMARVVCKMVPQAKSICVASSSHPPLTIVATLGLLLMGVAVQTVGRVFDHWVDKRLRRRTREITRRRGHSKHRRRKR